VSVLIDTSVWIDHFRHGNTDLVDLIGLNLVLTHPMVIAEIACGTPPAPRLQTLHNLSLLQSTKQASMSEVMDFIEREQLYGLGCGWVDLSLLASTLVTPGTLLWTLDKRLAQLASRFRVAFLPGLH
jgi:predicted nucleic acid-binding protein